MKKVISCLVALAIVPCAALAEDEPNPWKDITNPVDRLYAYHQFIASLDDVDLSLVRQAANDELYKRAAVVDTDDISLYSDTMDYNDIIRTPVDHFEELVKFHGEVIQILKEDSNWSETYTYELLVKMDDGNIVHVDTYQYSTFRILKNDKITVYGQIERALYTYTNRLGDYVGVPDISTNHFIIDGMEPPKQ